jgi:hypothetical protein
VARKSLLLNLVAVAVLNSHSPLSAAACG